MPETIHEVRDNQRYIVGDVEDVLPTLELNADVICLDDAWARPQRADWFGVEYETHDFSSGADSDGITTTDILDLCKDSLVEGGWLIADADDWLLPRLINYLRKDWGDVAASYDGGGYRRIGGVTFQTKAGEPDKSTPGMYLSNGGYPVVFAHKGETDRRTSVSARQITRQASFDGDWGSVKPIDPYQAWLAGLLNEGEHLVVPCAGTAPAAIAAEQLFGEDIQYTCIDKEPKALEMFKKRRDEVKLTDEGELSTFE
ncbi:hypothetical protein [Salinibaculum rarum]|uniref:hypothetical protein n=1 Tax=Salinibaculum rarum TaxID=3058903 RepID=UPI002660045A|nr:hypothetical protein [Salinibaculum sp. KK48]